MLERRTIHSPIGLDVGQGFLRAAQLRRSGHRWSVCLVSSWSRPARTADAQNDSEPALRAARWLRRLNLRKRTVVAGLSPPDIELHAMELPPAPQSSKSKQQREAARWETKRLMSFEDGAAEIDYWPLPESRVMRSTAIGVAASHARLNDVLVLCRAAGLDCVRIDASSCALARFGTLFRGRHEAGDDVWGVLDLGARLSRLIVCIGDTPVLARSFGAGGNTWTEKLASSLSVSEEAAERHKCDFGIVKIARSREQTTSQVETPNVLGEMIYNVLRADLEEILGEVERSYRYALQCFSKRSPGPLILTGGGANMKNLDTLLAEKLGIDVVVPSFDRNVPGQELDFSQVRQQIREPIGTFACAIGLAVHEGASP